MLTIVPITLAEANAFVEQHHRHHEPLKFWKFGMAVSDEKGIVGVAMVNRPVSIALDNGWTLEVSRCCTDGTKNACSALYGAAWRAAKSLGYRRLITYTLPEEGGASLTAAGWAKVYESKGGTWDRKNRPRVDKHPTGQKWLWEAI